MSLVGKRFMITGHKQHGKDTVCDLLVAQLGYTFKSSSMFCCELFIFDELRKLYDYGTPLECYEDRDNHRKEWFDSIVRFNGDDLARVSKAIFSEYDIYCGIRNRNELYAAKEQGVYDISIWVDAADRKPLESSDSLTITADDCDYILDNNGDITMLTNNVIKLFNKINEDQYHGTQNN